METTAAILLRKTKFSETSLIVTWFTEAHGKIKTVAKGARQPKSKFAGGLDLFFDCEIQFARSRKSELHILREVALREPHAGMRLAQRDLTQDVQFTFAAARKLNLAVEKQVEPAGEFALRLPRSLRHRLDLAVRLREPRHDQARLGELRFAEQNGGSSFHG